ncbi:MAG: hypothetical protein U5K30_13920 [Acidimicrobiales bacterium]|nr:hypothetical protein [Acidimicrobiales bacterium]
MSAPRRLRGALLTWAVGLGVLRLTFWAPEVCPTLTSTAARATAVDAGEWIQTNQETDGRYLYGWDRDDAEVDTGYNLVRHAGVTMSLYQLAEAGEIQFLEPADRGLDWMLGRLEPAGDGVAFADGSRAKLGASALLVVSLAHRRLVTDDTGHDETMLELGHFLQGQQRANGAMLNFYDLDADARVPEETSVYSTGEALWAIALLDEAFPDEGFEPSAWTTLDYITTERDAAEGYWPEPWPDQWAAYSLAEMAEWGLEDHHVEYAREMLHRYASFVRFDAQRGTTYGDLTHGPEPRGSGFGTWIEGLAELRELTTVDQRMNDLTDGADETLACGAARLAESQTPAGADVPPQVAGAWFYDGQTRMDDQQHAASGMLGAEPVLP